MMLRTATRWRLAARTQLPPVASPRFLSSSVRDKPTVFTASIPKSLARNGGALVKKLRELCEGTSIARSEGRGHDAAVVLASPGLTSLVDSEAFSRELVSWLGQEDGRFDLLSAVVDAVPTSSKASKTPSEGIAILRGPSDVILPQLENPEFLRDRRDHDTVGALSLDGLGDSLSSTVSVPLSRTIFHNARPSTLIISRFDLSSEAPPQMVGKSEAVRQHINLAGAGASDDSATKQPHLWLPLTAVSTPRKVTESFGNILRRLDYDGKSSPASAELEANIGSIRKAILDASPQVETALPGVWAVVDPEPGATLHARDWHVQLPEEADAGITIQALENGGRPFRLLSGGGGWGDKAGLLSLDPETSPFAASEEEDMRNLFGIGGASDYAAVGSEVQFFVPDLVASEHRTDEDRGLVFGISEYDPETADATEDSAAGVQGSDIAVVPGQFGVLSNEAVYISSEDLRPFKLNVPGSRLSIS